MEYRPAMDGLRALAVIAVLVFHLDGAFLGVLPLRDLTCNRPSF